MAAHGPGVPVPALSQRSIELDQSALVLEGGRFREAVLVRIPLALLEEMAGGHQAQVPVVGAGGGRKCQASPVVVSGGDVGSEALTPRCLEPDVNGSSDRSRSQERSARSSRDVDARESPRGQGTNAA